MAYPVNGNSSVLFIFNMIFNFHSHVKSIVGESRNIVCFGMVGKELNILCIPTYSLVSTCIHVM